MIGQRFKFKWQHRMTLATLNVHLGPPLAYTYLFNWLDYYCFSIYCIIYFQKSRKADTTSMVKRSRLSTDPRLERSLPATVAPVVLLGNRLVPPPPPEVQSWTFTNTRLVLDAIYFSSYTRSLPAVVLVTSNSFFSISPP